MMVMIGPDVHSRARCKARNLLNHFPPGVFVVIKKKRHTYRTVRLGWGVERCVDGPLEPLPAPFSSSSLLPSSLELSYIQKSMRLKYEPSIQRQLGLGM